MAARGYLRTLQADIDLDDVTQLTLFRVWKTWGRIDYRRSTELSVPSTIARIACNEHRARRAEALAAVRALDLSWVEVLRAGTCRSGSRQRARGHPTYSRPLTVP